MPLSGNFSLRDVSNEFGSNTRPATLSLRNFYTAIFGSAPAGSRLSDFAGYGKPVFSGESASTSSTLGGVIDMTFTVDVGSLSTTVDAQYQESAGKSVPDSNWTNATVSATYTTNGTRTFEIDVPNVNTSYYIRVRGRNKFVEDAEVDYALSSHAEAVSSGAEQWNQPTIDDAFIIGSNIHVEWNYGDEPSSFEAQYDEDSDGNWENATLFSSTNWGTTTNPKEGEWQVGRSISGGRVRIRASAEGGVNASNWSTPWNL